MSESSDNAKGEIALPTPPLFIYPVSCSRVTKNYPAKSSVGMAIEIILSESKEGSGKETIEMWRVGVLERVIKMNDRELLYLKFRKQFSTHTLLVRFPRQRKRIIEVALLEINARRLQKLIHEKKVWARLRVLKKKYRELCHNKKAESEGALVCHEKHN